MVERFAQRHVPVPFIGLVVSHTIWRRWQRQRVMQAIATLPS
jgi:hypothetical protein